MIVSNRIKSAGSDRVFVLVNSVLLVAMFVILLYPMWFVLIASVSNPTLVSTGKVLFWPKGFSLGGYEKVLSFGDLWIGYGNTLFYTVAGTMLNLAATLPCAYALSRKDMPGRGFIMTLFVITMYFGGGLIPSYLNIRELGLNNTRSIMLINGLVSAFNVIVCRTFFATAIPWELHEAAYVDGCSDFRTFLKIILPLSMPIVVVMSLYYGVGRWNSYFEAMIYLKDRSMYPLQLFLREILIQSDVSKKMLMEVTDAQTMKALFAQADVANLAKYCVIVVSTLPMMLIYPWLQRFFAKGVMIGSIKG